MTVQQQEVVNEFAPEMLEEFTQALNSFLRHVRHWPVIYTFNSVTWAFHSEDDVRELMSRLQKTVAEAS